jgi:hypothetical protein
MNISRPKRTAKGTKKNLHSKNGINEIGLG